MKQKTEESEGEDDIDQSFLDQVLNKLYDFGDSGKDKKKKPRKKRKKISDEEEEDKCGDMHNSSRDSCGDCSDMAREQIIAASLVTNSENTEPDTKRQNVEIVTFQDPLKKKKTKITAEPETPTETKERQKINPSEFSIEKARFEVHRFGITGYQKSQQRLFEQERAIMLGAKPPKKEYVNYKEYQQMLKEKKLKEKEEAVSEPKKTKKRKEGKAKNAKGKSSGDLGGHVGRFKDGMLLLSPKEIQKINPKIKK
ncbi:40S small subunit processome assembly factor 1 [Chanos chanos]|uniref:40S small subunit processome assembly factor 1 n=1 Tax=Chanos chanos TaxID=29144 RepID=A0A6J2W4Z2_CHACN|nr:uncharacterized protein C1orf131 homolog [Chanos chanos]